MAERQQYETNLRELIKESGYTFKEVSEETGISLRTLFDYASGKVSIPHQCRTQIAKVLGRDATEIVSIRRPSQEIGKSTVVLTEHASSSKPFVNDTIQATDVVPIVLPKVEENAVPISDTGLRSSSTLTEQQPTLLAALLSLGESIMFDPTKRKTLEAFLATLSVALVKPQGMLQAESLKALFTPIAEVSKTSAATIQGLKELIGACWSLSRGNELALAEELLPTCMAKVVPLAQQPSPYQQEAIKLAAQGFRLSGLMAFHRSDVPAQELSYKQAAVQYSRLSGDQSLLIPALRGLGTTYYYKGQYLQALHTYRDALDALQHMENASPLLQACVYMSLAVAYAHVDQSQDAFAYLERAHEVFPDHPEVDPDFSHVEFDHSQMILWEGVTRSRLGQTQQTFDIFNQIGQSLTVSGRLRVEILNQQAKTAILSGNLEQGSTYVEAGILGAKALGSQRRYSEAYANFQQMRLLWPQEKQVMALGELFH